MVEEALEKAQKLIREALQPCVGSNYTEEMFHRIKTVIHNTLYEIGKGNGQDIKFEVDKSDYNEGTINVIPSNLFTLLLMHGIYVPSYRLTDNFYETDMGTFGFEYGKPYLKPKIPIDDFN